MYLAYSKASGTRVELPAQQLVLRQMGAATQASRSHSGFNERLAIIERPRCISAHLNIPGRGR